MWLSAPSFCTGVTTLGLSRSLPSHSSTMAGMTFSSNSFRQTSFVMDSSCHITVPTGLFLLLCWAELLWILQQAKCPPCPLRKGFSKDPSLVVPEHMEMTLFQCDFCAWSATRESPPPRTWCWIHCSCSQNWQRCISLDHGSNETIFHQHQDNHTIFHVPNHHLRFELGWSPLSNLSLQSSCFPLWELVWEQRSAFWMPLHLFSSSQCSHRHPCCNCQRTMIVLLLEWQFFHSFPWLRTTAFALAFSPFGTVLLNVRWAIDNWIVNVKILWGHNSLTFPPWAANFDLSTSKFSATLSRFLIVSIQSHSNYPSSVACSCLTFNSFLFGGMLKKPEFLKCAAFRSTGQQDLMPKKEAEITGIFILNSISAW